MLILLLSFIVKSKFIIKDKYKSRVCQYTKEETQS